LVLVVPQITNPPDFNSSGYFSFDSRRVCSQHNLRVQVRLDDSNLQVANPGGEEWMTIYTTPSKRGSGTLQIGSRVFDDDVSGTLGARGNVRRAITWYMVKTVQTRLAAEHDWLKYDRKIHVRYPANTVGDVSYAEGITMTAYIDVHGTSDAWDADTVLHEVMHLWNYQHNHGTTNWVSAVLHDGSTHGFQEDPNVAFHEGFAEFAKDELLYNIWGRDKRLPRSRRGLATQDLVDLDVLDGSDRGVKYALYLLTSEDVYGLRFGTDGQAGYGSVARRVPVGASCPASPDLTLWDVMLAFKGRDGTKWERDWEVGRAGHGIYRFFDRITDLNNRFSASHKSRYLALLDPESSVEPSYWCP